MTNEGNNNSRQLDVLIPNNFVSGSNYIPLAQLNTINGQQLPAIGNYSTPPSTGTFVLGSVNGSIQWIATQDCQ
jgi:hypothetical protein